VEVKVALSVIILEIRLIAIKVKSAVVQAKAQANLSPNS
jgi:hypothetical protein